MLGWRGGDLTLCKLGGRAIDGLTTGTGTTESLHNKPGDCNTFYIHETEKKLDKEEWGHLVCQCGPFWCQERRRHNFGAYRQSSYLWLRFTWTLKLSCSWSVNATFEEFVVHIVSDHVIPQDCLKTAWSVKFLSFGTTLWLGQSIRCYIPASGHDYWLSIQVLCWKLTRFRHLDPWIVLNKARDSIFGVTCQFNLKIFAGQPQVDSHLPPTYVQYSDNKWQFWIVNDVELKIDGN